MKKFGHLLDMRGIAWAGADAQHTLGPERTRWPQQRAVVGVKKSLAATTADS
jgi:hypothetical protein